MKNIILGSIIFDRYRIEKKIGSGSTGSVYLSTDLKLGTSLAIKILNNQIGEDEQWSIEENTLKLLNHRSLPQIIDVLRDSNFTYIIESYIEGIPLERLYKDYNKFSEKQVIEWSIQICEALAYLHFLKPNPIIYRDLKPSNIIITRDYRAILVDFGSCIKYIGKHHPDDTIIGTKLYSAPEQLLIGGVSDYRTDIYCLGLVIYQLVTGELPHNNISAKVNTYKNLSKGMKYIIGKCVAKDKAKRFNNVEELRCVLNEHYKYVTPLYK